MKPKISCMMLTHNRKDFLRESIKGVINQTYKDFELIIIDNGSTDGTEEVVKEFNDERIVYVRNEENFHPGALNQMVNLAKGEYIAICDDDDISLPERFEKSVEFLEKNLDVAMIGGGVIFIDKEGKETKKVKYPKEPTFDDIYKSDGMISTPTVIMRKKIIEEVGLYDTTLYIAPDYDLYLRIAKEHKIRNLDFFLSKYRVHNTNASLINLELTAKYRKRVLLKYAEASCLCFSYNRVFQLENYIRSFLRFVSGVQLNVRYQYSEEKYKKGYEELIKRYPEVNFIEGNGLTDFQDQVLNWLKNAPNFIMFGCDDVIFKDDVDIEKVIEKVKLPDTIGFSLRLGKGLTYNFPLDKNINEPKYEESDGILRWEWKNAEGDYGYPFELDASIYKKEFVENLINSLGVWGHPNLLEGLGANLITNQISDMPKYLYSFSSPKALVIQINKVQTLSPNKFYDTGYDVETLFNLWKKGEKLNLDYYGKTFNSTYVKEFMLEGEEDKMIKITVGVPIFNQNVSYFRKCLESIKNQSYQNFEVIILDDGSDNKEEVEKMTNEFGFKYVYQKNAGIGSARQSIVDNASKETEFITFLSSDDIWDEKFLEVMINESEKHSKKVIYSGYYLVDGEEKALSKINPPTFDSHEDFCIFCWSASERNTMSVNFSCVFIPKIVFNKIKFKYKFSEDLYFLLTSMKDFEYHLVPQYLLKYRAVDNTTSRIMDKLPEINKKIREECRRYWKSG